MDRRDFAKTAGFLLASTWLGCKKDAPASSAPSEKPAQPAPKPVHATVFKEDEAKALGAALDRLLPAGIPDGTPGAKEAGVMPYVEGQLQQPHFKAFIELMRSGGRALNGAARKEFKTRWFWELDTAQQDALLQRFQTGSIRVGRFNTARFFEVLRTFSLEGFLGHSRHGGNLNEVAWQSIGFSASCH